MKDWNITDIENIKEEEAKTLCLDTMVLKEHNLYFVDFGGYFGYSCLVFKNNHSIHYANDYELHHNGKTKEELKKIYIDRINDILFTEAEIAEPLKNYDEYTRKRHYLHNYYGMQVENLSICRINLNYTDAENKEYEEKIKSMFYNPIAFAYMNDMEFIKHHIELSEKLEKVKAKCDDNYEYQKNAFLIEMYNHEYGINFQADFDVLSSFGNISRHGEDLEIYFKELGFTHLQKKAYMDARKEYLKKIRFIKMI